MHLEVKTCVDMIIDDAWARKERELSMGKDRARGMSHGQNHIGFRGSYPFNMPSFLACSRVGLVDQSAG